MACVENYYYFCKKQLKMVLTYPIFLWALFSLSIPIIIHLFNFRKYKTLYFSNTRFVDHVKKDTKTRNKLKQYLILLMRLLMLTALIISFARPVIPIKEQDKYRAVDAIAIYIDNSFSMESESEQGPLLTQAIDKALKLVNALPDDIHYYLITNDFLPEHQRAYNKSDIIQIIGNIDISPNIKSIDQVIKKAIVLKSESKELDIYIISDFQKKFIKPVDIDNENISISIMPLNVNGQNNIFIDSCWFTEPVRIFNQSDELLVKIRNISDVSYVDIPVNLYINDTLKAISSLNIDAKEDKTIKLGYTNTSKGINKGVVSISDYPVTFDNELYFSYRIAEEINVLIING
ncbi:MAG: BatA domain-containing protein, partial [Bacteroidales bacterium]|nr:BatA domain-containing protein [Bacteroidales bacterium]